MIEGVYIKSIEQHVDYQSRLVELEVRAVMTQRAYSSFKFKEGSYFEEMGEVIGSAVLHYLGEMLLQYNND